MPTTRRNRLSRLSAGALAVICSVAVAGCSGSTDGEGTAAGDSAATTSDSATTAETTESTAESTAESTETTAETTETTEDSGGDDGELTCDAENVLAPDGQPFCSDIPDGFTQTEITTDNEAGSAAAYSTGLAISEQDVILFSYYLLTQDSDVLSDDDLGSALAPVISQLAAQGFVFDTQEPDIQDIDDARAFVYTGNDGAGLNSDLYFVFRGTTELQVTCQWAEQEDTLLAGCDEVLDSVELTG